MGDAYATRVIGVPVWIIDSHAQRPDSDDTCVNVQPRTYTAWWSRIITITRTSIQGDLYLFIVERLIIPPGFSVIYNFLRSPPPPPRSGKICTWEDLFAQYLHWKLSLVLRKLRAILIWFRETFRADHALSPWPRYRVNVQGCIAKKEKGMGAWR